MARVLIVDDSVVGRKNLRHIILSLGHQVVGEVPNGLQALQEYTKLKPDLVTMNLMMQDMRSAEVISEIILTYPEARIIGISGKGERQLIIDTLERGAQYCMIKPITVEKFMNVLKNIL